MKRNLAVAALAFALSATCAQAQFNVAVYEKGSEEPATNLPLSEVQKIVVGGPTLKVVSADGTESSPYQLQSLRKLVFNHDVINGLKVIADAEPKLRLEGDMLSFSGWDRNQVAPLSIYAADGKCMQHVASWCGQSLNVALLPKGMYVLTVGRKSYKFSK